MLVILLYHRCPRVSFSRESFGQVGKVVGKIRGAYKTGIRERKTMEM